MGSDTYIYDLVSRLKEGTIASVRSARYAIDAIVAKLAEVEATDVAAFNRAVEAAGIPPVSAGAVGR